MQSRSTTGRAIAFRMTFTLITAGMVLSAATPRAHAQCDPGEIYKLWPTDGAGDDQFAYSVAISGTIAVVGARDDDDNGTYSGSAYLFDTITGEQLFKLLPSDGAEEDWFGTSVAMSGTTAVVDAYKDDDNGENSGSAYLFDTTTGLQLFKLLPDDGAANDQFGHAVAISGTTAIVAAIYDDDNGGASGSAYLFDTTTGLQLHKLLPNDGAGGDYFGSSVAISGTTAIVGASSDDDNGYWSGSAYLFDTITGEQLFKLLPNDGGSFDQFGWSVSISGTTAIVGAPLSESKGRETGSAYLFDTTTGQQVAKLRPNDGRKNDYFGVSVAINGITAIVGAEGDDDRGHHSGSAYIFNTTNGQQAAKVVPIDGKEDDLFGWSVSISGTTALVGAYANEDKGSAYVFDLEGCPHCLSLVVENLVAGDNAVFDISGGTRGARVVTVYGTKPGRVSFNDFAGYCATFSIQGVTKGNVLGGYNRRFDENGEVTFNVGIPANASGMNVLFQSAQHDTCPNECMSNLVKMVVQ